MTLLIVTLAALTIGYLAARLDYRRQRWDEAWWAGHRVGHDLGFKAGRLSRAKRNEEGAEQ